MRTSTLQWDGALHLERHGAEVIAPSALFRLNVDRRRHDALAAIDPGDASGGDLGLTVRGTLPGTAVAVEWTARRIIADADVWEFGLVLENHGEAPVAVSRMDPVALRLPGDPWTIHGYRSAWGDEFRPFTETTDSDQRFESRSGRSSHGMAPWVAFESAAAAIVVAPAWSGNWHVDVREAATVTAGISDWQFETLLGLGERTVAPSVVVAVGADVDDAALALTDALGRAWTPRSAASDRLDVEWNHWWPYEDVEVDAAAIDANARIAAELGIGFATVDAGWFGPADPTTQWWRYRGDWDLVNTARFPGGLPALGDAIRAAGVRPGIWVEAEAIGVRSAARRERPEILALAVDGRRPDPSYGNTPESLDPDDPTFLGYVCCGSPEGREFVLDSLDRTVRAMGAEWVKLDFNVDPDAGCTRTDHGHGARDGLYRHYEGLYAVLDELRARHPELVLEACSSGGLRIDLGLARHVHTLFLSDPDYTEHHLQVLWGASRMLPPASILHWSWSQWRGDYPPSQLDFATLSDEEFATTLRAAMLHRFGVSLRLPELSDRQREILDAHVRAYTEHVAPLVRAGTLRPLTAQPRRRGRGERSPAFQLSDGRRLIVAAFRLDGDEPDAVAHPVGLDADARYRVRDLISGAAYVTTGAELSASGIAAPAREGRFSSLLLSIDPEED
ncbi:alpha-galactosidase [Microbacterium sp.]|uniref:alpha-galactosidase n=2 Tax=unclassified Microbacterium TaxID=2609290 RepID=UPI001AD04CBF|nr:alpha-galactosidase [Microbacterium sp.]MBN9193423.1 alpha-galactosidase [Microbacterium sp.]